MNEVDDKSESIVDWSNLQTNKFNYVDNNVQIDQLNPENNSVLNHEMTFTDSQEESKNILVEEINIGKKNIKIEEELEGIIDAENESQDLSAFYQFNSNFSESLTEEANKYIYNKEIVPEQSIIKIDEESNNISQKGNKSINTKTTTEHAKKGKIKFKTTNRKTRKRSSKSKIKANDGGSIVIEITNTYPTEEENRNGPIFKIIKQSIIRKKRKKRRDDEDNIRKKFKGYVFKWIKPKLNIELTKYNIPYEFDFSQSMTTNVSIQENKKFLNMTVKELLLDEYEYEKNEDKKDYNIRNTKKNKEIIQFLKDKNSKNIVTILEKNLKDVYIEFIESYSFKKTIKKLGKKFDNQYITKYIEVSKNFVNYYEKEKPKKK